MSALPLQSAKAHAAASVPLHSTPRSATLWALTLGAGLLAALVLLQLIDFRAPFSDEREEFSPMSTVLFAGAVWMIVKGVKGALQWGRMRALAKQHPLEPWLWDYPWQRELVDTTPQLAAVAGLPMLLLFGLFLGAINVAVVFMGIGESQFPMVPLLIGCAFLALVDVAFIRYGILSFKRQMAELRQGLLRLRLPQIPLALGTQPQLELVLPRGLPNLRRVKIVLRRVYERTVTTRSGNSTRIRTKSDIEYKQTLELEVRELRGTDGLFFELDLPPAVPEASTALNGNPARVWEIEIAFTVPKVGTPTTFKLPVYFVDGG
ncbi:MAG TPA: hypothetical protein VNA24_22295 [Hyalangium sp.]|nr:hypothetical protein [Hyalangium sp.]